MSKVTDIVVTTRNRPHYLRKTLAHIFERTRSPHLVHVIDDASTDDTNEYLRGLLKENKIANLLTRGVRAGQMANLNVGAWLACSDPVVLVDDDILCPDVEPDWLSRGLEVMKHDKGLGILALNHPGAVRRTIETNGRITYCRYVGGTFMFVRRALLLSHPLPHYHDNFGVTPTVQRCNKARSAGLKIGYLTDTYCYHIGLTSAITGGKPYGGRDIVPVDWKTLEPPEGWCK